MAILKPNPRPTQQFRPKNMGWPHGVPTQAQEEQKADGAAASGEDAESKVEQLPYPVDPYGNNNQPISVDKKSALPVNTYMLVQSSTQSVMDVKACDTATAQH